MDFLYIKTLKILIFTSAVGRLQFIPVILATWEADTGRISG
jgi:hypothetical protein